MHSSVSLTHCSSYYEQTRNPEQLLMSVMGINNGARPVVCNCVGGVSVGSAGHSPSLPNEGNTTLPHTSTLHSHLQSQAPLPVSITPSAIDILAGKALPRHHYNLQCVQRNYTSANALSNFVYPISDSAMSWFANWTMFYKKQMQSYQQCKISFLCCL